MSSCAPRAGGSGVIPSTVRVASALDPGAAAAAAAVSQLLLLGVRGYKSGGLLGLSYGVSTCGVDHQTLPYLYN